MLPQSLVCSKISATSSVTNSMTKTEEPSTIELPLHVFDAIRFGTSWLFKHAGLILMLPSKQRAFRNMELLQSFLHRVVIEIEFNDFFLEFRGVLLI